MNSSAMGRFTGTCSLPSATRILPSLPSSAASTSMVALSVSISAMTSPARTLSPSRTSHLTSFPSSMVGESAGMRISLGISFGKGSGRNVGEKLGRVGLGIAVRELRRLVHAGADLAVDLLQLGLAGAALLQNPVA